MGFVVAMFRSESKFCALLGQVVCLLIAGDVHMASVGRIMIHYRARLLSLVLRARWCHKRFLTSNILFIIQNSEIILEMIKPGFSEVL